MDRYQVAQVLREIGFMIEITDPIPKKSISYYRAAKTIESTFNFNHLVSANALSKLPGIGKVISDLISSLVKKNYSGYYNHLRNHFPADLFQLNLIPGLGAKRIRFLYETFNVRSISQLELLLTNVKDIKGFGPAYVKKILAQIEIVKKGRFQLLYPSALSIANAFQEFLKPYCSLIEISGSLRRKNETIERIDLLLIGNSISLELISKHAYVSTLISINKKQLLVSLKQGINACFTLVSEEVFPFVQLFCTGSKTHTDQLQYFSIGKNYLSIDGFDESRDIMTEEEIYNRLGLNYIPPEVREGLGEIEYARQHHFNLIEHRDLKGVFHCHTDYSDGHNSIVEMMEEAKKLGWEYLGISDHSKSSYQAGGMSEEKLLEQLQMIQQLNQDPNFQLFAGIECDILKDGQLDYPEDILKQLDFVIISVHRYFSQDKEQMTARIIKAIENPYSTIVGHLTGRLLRLRTPYAVDIDQVIDACIANGKVMELNCCPNRLDMDWRYWIKAREKGLKCSINPDAHSIHEFHHTVYGVNIARKGWLRKEDVINTLSLNEIKTILI